jgi:hypothetical protein
MTMSSHMRSVDRALDVLYLLGRRSAPMPAKEIAETLALPKGTNAPSLAPSGICSKVLYSH